jgi:NAD(P)H-dependent flavin oxidoreductase YrpB (nitropropane dioxygenase family)
VNKDLVQMGNNQEFRQVVSHLKTLVNNPQQWDHFNNYLDLLIQQQQRTLEQGDNTILMHRAQGAIAVLRSMKTLRDVING